MKKIENIVVRGGDSAYYKRRFKGKYERDNGVQTLHLEIGSDDLEEFKEYAKKQKVKYDSYYSREYTEEEKASLPYFHIFPPSPKDLWDCTTCGVPFSYACECCGAGAKQLGPVFLHTKRAMKYDFFLVRPVIIISEKLRKELEEIEATGYRLKEVYDIKTKETDSRFFQLEATEYLPETRDEGSGWKIPIVVCPKCGTKAIKFQGGPSYFLEDFKDRHDFYYTAEESIWVPRYTPARHELIVSRRVWERIIGYDVMYEPVHIEELYQ